MRLEHLVVPESKEILKQNKQTNKNPTLMRVWQRNIESQEPNERANNDWSWNNLVKLVLDYNTKYKISKSFVCLFVLFFCLFVFWPCHMACRILVPWWGTKPVPPAVGVWSLSHWITKEVLQEYILIQTIE